MTKHGAIVEVTNVELEQASVPNYKKDASTGCGYNVNKTCLTLAYSRIFILLTLFPTDTFKQLPSGISLSLPPL